MADTRKSARMSERRRLAEEDEERKREDDRKRQRTLFQRKDNIIRNNDLVVDTRLGKVALVSEEAPEDVKVKVETNDTEYEIQQGNYSDFSDEEHEKPIVIISTTTLQTVKETKDNRPETDDNKRSPISSSSGVDRTQETNASQTTAATNEQFEAKLTSLTLELEGMKQLVTEQNQTIVQLSTELETVKRKEQENISLLSSKLESILTEMESEKKEMNRCLEENERTTKAELEVFKRENRRLEVIVNQLTGNDESVKRKREEESNASRGATVQRKTFPDVTTPRTRMIIDPGLEAVLSRILKLIEKDFQTLRTFRLVSRAWNQVSLHTWRNTAVINLRHKCTPSGTTGGISATQFLQEYRNDQSPYGLADKPYSRYKLEDVFIDKGNNWNRFWRLIGPLMEYVHLQNCVIAYTTSDAFPKLLIQKMPNLKELALTSVTYDDKPDTRMPLLDGKHSQLKSLVLSGRNQICLDRLLVCLPSLEVSKSIRAVHDGDKTYVYGDMLDKIGQSKRLDPANLPNLKHLDFMNTFTQLKTLNSCRDQGFYPQFKRLVDTNLQLKSFAFKFAPVREEEAASIKLFLKTQATTLQVLKLFHAPMRKVNFKSQVEMTALKELYLWGSIVLGLDFLKYTPNLKVLFVNLTCFEKRNRIKAVVSEFFYNANLKKFLRDTVQTVELLMEGVTVNSLETLHVDYEFPDKSLRTLAKAAPNLKILKTIVSGKNVSAVVEEWRELKELTCLFESKIRDWDICKDDTRPHGNKEAVISDLKKLEHFQLDCLCDASKLTDASVFHGFLKMSSLKSVQLCVSKQFSDEAEEALRDRVKNCRVIRNFTGGDHFNYGCCQLDLDGLRIES